EVYRVDKIGRTSSNFAGPSATVEATVRKENRRVEAGTILVRTAQPLGTLAAYLLEPQSEDGYGTWNFFDTAMAEGKDYPVLRLPAMVPMTMGRPRPLPEDRTLNKRITLASQEGGRPSVNISGSPVSQLTWLEDGEHFLQVRDGKLMKVHARTGRSQPF